MQILTFRCKTVIKATIKISWFNFIYTNKNHTTVSSTPIYMSCSPCIKTLSARPGLDPGPSPVLARQSWRSHNSLRASMDKVFKTSDEEEAPHPTVARGASPAPTPVGASPLALTLKPEIAALAARLSVPDADLDSDLRLSEVSAATHALRRRRRKTWGRHWN